ncbi:hypothetical protein D1007_55756 [Hordeum vulgare]|nr:hypothetical protein D1007_55756 [Hordeum vulgare]
MVDEIDRQNGWTTKQTTFRAELVDLKSDSKVGYVPSELAAQMVDDGWASERQIMAMCTGEVTVLHEGADADAQEGSDGVARVLSVDWNSVELNEPTDLVIAPMDDTEMAKFFGIPVPGEDKEENDETSMLTDAKRDICEDVDGQLMEDAADDVDDAHDDELGKKDGKPKRSQKGNKNRCKLCQELGHRAGSSKCCYTPKRPKRKCASEPLVVEDCWPKKKKRGNGCRKKRSYGETMQTEQNEQDLDVLQNEQQDLDVFQNEDVVQNEQDLDVLQNQDVVQNEQDMDLVPNNYLPADVVQAEPILEVVLPNPVFPEDVVQNEQDMDLVPNDYLPADVVQAELILEVVLPNPVFPQDVVPTKPILEVLLPTELDDIPADAVMKTKSFSELGIVVKRSTDKKKKKKKKKKKLK